MLYQPAEASVYHYAVRISFNTPVHTFCFMYDDPDFSNVSPVFLFIIVVLYVPPFIFLSR